MYSDIKSTIDDHAIIAVENKVLDQVQKTLTSTNSPADDSASSSASETLNIKHNALGKAILELLKKAFDDKQRQQLGVDIHITPDSWFKTGHIEFKVHTSADIKSAGTHNRLPRLIQTDTEQYLAEKNQRRNDASMFAVRYKSVIAKLIQQLTNAIYHRQLSSQEHIHYLECLDGWISLIRQDKNLFNQKKNHDAHDQHFESFLLEVQRKIITEIDTLRLRTDAHQVHKWLTDWQDELRVMLRNSVLWWHTAIHTQPVPKNLYEQLEKLGAAYQRHLELQFMHATDGRIKIAPERLKYWQQQKTITLKKLQSYTHREITDTVLKQAAQEKVISWEEYYFYNSSEGYYTALQLLWELLYHSKELPLSATAIKDELCYDKVLDCYRASDDATKHHWFLCLLADIQIAHSMTPHLIELCEQKDTTSKATLISQLCTHIKQFADAKWLHTIPESWHPGILTEIDSLLKTPCPQTTRAMALLSNIKRYQAQLTHVCGSLELYRKVLPSTGEIIGALALGQHLQGAVHLVKQCGGQFEKDILELNQLLRFGAKEQSGLQTIVLQHQVAWYERTKSQAISTWLSTEKERQQQGIVLSDALRKCICKAHELTQHCSPAVLMERASSTEQLFLIADEISTPFLPLNNKKESNPGHTIIHEFKNLVSTKVATIDDKKIEPTPTSRVSITPPTACSTAVIPLVVPSSINPILLAPLQTCALTILSKLQQGTLIKFDEVLTVAQQEIFFTTLSALYATHTSEQWSELLHKQLGITWSPLPQLIAPTRFLWWYRHTLKDRALFFRALYLSTVINHFKENPALLTHTQQQQLQQLLVQEHANAEFHYQSHSSMLDSFHCRIRTKYKTWRNKLQEYLVFIPQLSVSKPAEASASSPVTDEAIRSTKPQAHILIEGTSTTASLTEERRLSFPPSSELKETATSGSLVKSIRVEQKNISNQSCTSLPCLAQSSQIREEDKKKIEPVPLPSVPALSLPLQSLDWKEYRQQLIESADSRKQHFCLTFLVTVLSRIKSGTLDLNDSAQQQQFHQAISLFWYAIKATELANTTYGVHFESMQGGTFTKLSGKMQQHFFVTKTPRIIESYEPTLLLTLH